MIQTLEQLLFVRHAESRHQVDGLVGGWTDTSLTEAGRAQARGLADHLAARLQPGWTLYSSDLARAAETAEWIGRALHSAWHSMPELREINLGAATGLPVAEALSIAAPEPGQPDLEWRQYEGAESYREMAERLHLALALLRETGRQRIIVVGHGLSGQELVRAWLGVPLAVPLGFRFDPASMTELAYNRWGEPEICRLNVQPGAD